MCFVIVLCHHQPLTLLPPTRTFQMCIIVCVCDSHLHTLTADGIVCIECVIELWMGMFDLSAAYAIMEDTYAELYVQLSHTKSNKVMSLSRSDVQCELYIPILQKRLHYHQHSVKTNPTYYDPVPSLMLNRINKLNPFSCARIC